MTERLTLQQKQLIDAYRQNFSELRTYSDEQILSIINNSASSVNLSEDEKVSILFNPNELPMTDGMERENREINLSDSDKKQLISILTKRVNDVEAKTKEAEKENGFLGKAWSWTKNNLLDWCTDSTNDIEKARKEELEALKTGKLNEAFEKITGLEFNQDNLNKFLNNEVKTKSEQALEGYKEGQEMAADFAGDMISGIAAIGIYMGAIAAAPFTGGASIALGLAAATAGAGLIKSGIKYADAKSADREYNTFGKDMITGGFSGVLAPFTGGVGGAVGRNVAARLGVQAMKHVGKEVVEQTGKQTLKTMLMNPTGYEYVGGSLVKRGVSLAAEMATDGALSGAVDGTFREGVEEIEKEGSLDAGKLGSAFVQGGVGGFFMAPAIGGGMKGVGKLFGKTKIALSNGKTLELTEDFGLTYKQADTNLEKGRLFLYDKPVASTKKELMKQLEAKGFNVEKDYDLKNLIKNCKTEEDFQKLSIVLLNASSNNTYLVSRNIGGVKTLDDAAALSMLIGQKLPYDLEKALNCIRENPLMFGVYREVVPIIDDRELCILNRTIGSKLKTQEECDLFIEFVKNAKGYMSAIESIYCRDLQPKTPEELASTLAFLQYHSATTGYYGTYLQWFETVEEFLRLSPEARKLLEPHIKAYKENPYNSYNKIVLNKNVFNGLLKGLKDENASESLMQLIKKIDDFKELELIYSMFLRDDFTKGTYDKEVIERLNKLISTKAGYSDQDSYYQAQYYISKYTNKKGERVFNTKENYFEELLNMIEDKEIQAKLGRVMSVGEASDFCREIKTDIQRNFALSKFTKDIEPGEINSISEKAGRIQNKDQVILAEALFEKPSTFKFGNEYYETRTYDLYKYLKTKEDIEAFLKIYSQMPFENNDLGDMYKEFLESGNFAGRVKFLDELPNLSSLLPQNLYLKLVRSYSDDTLMGVLKLLDKFIKDKPEFVNYFSGFAEYSIISRFNSPEVLEKLSRNIEILSKADDEFISMIKPKRGVLGEVCLEDFLLADNIDIEKFHLLKPYVNSKWNDIDELFDLVMSDIPISRIKEILPKINDLSDVKGLFRELSDENKKLYEILLKDPDFDINSIRRSIRTAHFKPAEFNTAAIDARIDFYNKYRANNAIKDDFKNILRKINFENKDIVDELVLNPDFPKNKIANIIDAINRDNIELARKLCTLKDFNIDEIETILSYTNKNNLKLADVLCYSPILKQPVNEIVNILGTFNRLIRTDVNNMTLSGKIRELENLLNIPKEMKELCRYADVDVDKLISELQTMLGKKRDAIRISAKKQQLFVQKIIANNNPKAENVLKNFDFKQYEKEGLPLKYSRQQFNENIEALIKDLNPDEQDLILSHFGLLRGEAGFDGLPTNKAFDSSSASSEVRTIAIKVQNEIENFTAKNEVKTGNAEADEVLNGLIQGLPEFTSIVGKQQHDTHAYSVDIHTLNVLQSAMNHPLYDSLSDTDKTILKFTALCHDFGKKGGVVDTGHASLSADYIVGILEKFNFPRTMKDRMIDIVENHHWFEAYNTGKATAEDVAVRCSRPQDFAIYEILAKSDFENVNDNFHISKSEGVTDQASFDIFMSNKMNPIGDVLNKIYSKSNLIFDTQFMLNGERFPRKITQLDGEPVEFKVLNLNELADDALLEAYGFTRGVTKDSARFTVHMTYPDEAAMESVNILTQNSLNQSAWSTSLIKASNNRTYTNRKFGFIFDVDQANISEAYYANTGSGTEKGLDRFKQILFTSNDEARTYVKDNFMNELSKNGIVLNDEEYVQLVRQLILKKYTTQIGKDIQIGDKVIKSSTVVECLEKARDCLFNGGDIHSEIVSINPRVKGLIAKVEKIEDCPAEFLKFAKKHDLPIILMRDIRE